MIKIFSNYIYLFRSALLSSFPVYILFYLLPLVVQAQDFSTKDPGIDFSYAGFAAGTKEIPSPPAVFTIKPTGDDDTALLQAAINQLASLPLGSNGFRGAILLSPGTFKIHKPLRIAASGIVLRGSNKLETTILSTTKDRISLIEIGRSSPPKVSSPIAVVDKIVPAGSMKLKLEDLQDLDLGDQVAITRPSTKEWISTLGMDSLSGNFAELRFHWKPGSRDLVWNREIVALDSEKKQVTLDAPITTSLNQKFGGGSLEKIIAKKPIQFVGIENLILESSYQKENPKDEEHAWFGITINHTENAWVKEITTRHLASSAVYTGPHSRMISIENCHYTNPVSEVGGYRRLAYLIEGQQVLVKNCTSDSGYNDFATGLLAAGPNVFLNCTATNALGASGTYESWAAGVLYEDVLIKGNDLRLTYDINRTQAGGWTAANSVIWNATADNIIAKGPVNAPVIKENSEKSLYRHQLKKRIGSTTKTPEKPSTEGIFNIPEFTKEDIPSSTGLPQKNQIPLKIVNGRFVTGSSVAWGGSVNDAWWLGKTNPTSALQAGRSITRFVPHRSGPGLTENLQKFMQEILDQGTPFYQSGPAIWYDRRRDDHSIKKRNNSNVWAAFYELPWARSGEGIAWDGLSKYDLTKFNSWYFKRTKTFAKLADENGIILYHHLYNNHNLLETASHWVDSPWRPANNINNTGLPEPPPLEPNNRIHIANQFYNTDNPELKKLHRSYILHVLDELGSFENIIFGLSFQYSGPLEFQQFFQQTVAEWEKKNNKKVKLVIDTGKNITDAILKDPVLSKQISVIDMRYWHYLPDGSLWAPKAGQNRAFRELHPKEFGDPTTAQQVYRQVREYHKRFPEKAIVSWHSGVDPVPALMAGGAQVLMRNPTAGHGQGKEIDRHPIDLFVQKHLKTHLMHMQPVDGMLSNPQKNWMLSNQNNSLLLIYSLEGMQIKLQKALASTSFKGTWFHPGSGETRTAHLTEKLKKGTVIQKPSEENWLLFLKAEY